MIKTINKKVTVFLLLIILTVSLFGCTKTNNITPISKTQYLLGTVINIKVYEEVDEKVFDEIFDRIKEIEDKMSINLDNSEVIEINNKSGIDYVSVSEDTFNVIKQSLHYSQLSEGNFDITIGPLVKLWNIGTEYAKVPDEKEINEKLNFVGYNKIQLDEKEKKVKLEHKNMIIDLGAIAKGYAADEIVKIMEDNNIKHAIIDIGGNVYTVGKKLDDSEWKIGVQNPFDDRGDYLGILEVSDKSIVTSGIYERYLESDDKRYHHILSPFTGYPVENSLASITIVSEKSIDGDALSTSVFSLGLEKGKNLVENLDNIDAIFVTKDSKVYVTSGIKNKFALTHKEFTMIN